MCPFNAEQDAMQEHFGLMTFSILNWLLTLTCKIMILMKLTKSLPVLINIIKFLWNKWQKCKELAVNRCHLFYIQTRQKLGHDFDLQGHSGHHGMTWNHHIKGRQREIHRKNYINFFAIFAIWRQSGSYDPNLQGHLGVLSDHS